MIVSSAALLDRRAAARRRIVRRVDVAVLRLGGRAKRLGIGEIADDRMRRRARRRAPPSRCRARAPSRRVRRARARRARRRRCIRSRRSERSASRPYIIVQPCPATRSSIFSAISRSARGDFLVYDDGFRSRSHTYERGRRAPRAASPRASHELGLRKGDKVVFWSENRPEWIVAFWGCLLRGVVVVPIDYRASPDFLVARQPHRRGEARADRSGRAAARGRPSTASRSGSCTSSTWPERSARPAPGVTDVPIARDDVAEIIFTSGATAEPKGVVITHRNVLANIVPVEREVLKYRKWSRPFAPVRFLNLLPLSHMFGQAMATFIPPMLPGVVVFMRGYNPGEIAAQIKKPPHLGARLGAEDPRRAARARAARRAPIRDVPGPEAALPPALVAVPRDPPAVRLEVLGVRRRRRAARQRRSRRSGPSSGSS